MSNESTPPEHTRCPDSALRKIQLTDLIKPGEREVHISHDGAVYKLKITKAGKLILNK